MGLYGVHATGVRPKVPYALGVAFEAFSQRAEHMALGSTVGSKEKSTHLGFLSSIIFTPLHLDIWRPELNQIRIVPKH